MLEDEPDTILSHGQDANPSGGLSPHLIAQRRSGGRPGQSSAYGRAHSPTLQMVEGDTRCPGGRHRPGVRERPDRMERLVQDGAASR